MGESNLSEEQIVQAVKIVAKSNDKDAKKTALEELRELHRQRRVRFTTRIYLEQLLAGNVKTARETSTTQE